MCDTNCTWVFNLLVVALLIQHAVHVAHAGEHVSVSAPWLSPAASATSATYAAVGDFVGAASVDASYSFGDDDDDNNENADDVNNHNSNNQSSNNNAKNNGEKNTENMQKSVEVDFAAYVNDFNIQAEASIPEDILDQQHIEDVDVIDADSLQYVGKGNSGNAGGSIQTAWRETTTADIILENQKSSNSGKNLSTHNMYENESNPNIRRRHTSNNSNSSNLKQQGHNSNRKFKNNRQEGNKLNTDYDAAVAAAVAAFDDNANANDNRNVDDDYVDGDVEQLEAAAVSAANNAIVASESDLSSNVITDIKKITPDAHSLTSSNENVGGGGGGDKFTNAQQQHSEDNVNSLEPMDDIEKFIEQRKFNNKLDVQTTQREVKMPTTSDNNNYRDEQSNVNKNIKAFEDFKFDVNNNNNNNKKKDIDINKSNEEDNQSEDSAIGDIEDNFRNQAEENEENEYAMSEQMPTTRLNEAAASAAAGEKSRKDTTTFVTRKIKRHNSKHNNMAQITRSRQERYGDANGREVNQYNNGNAAASETTGQQVEGASTEDVLKSQDSPNESHRQAATTMVPAAVGADAEADADAATLSAFELYKAQRRNNRRNGHKVHKKKYKDYLRYAGKSILSAPLQSTTVNAASNTTQTQLTNVTKGDQQQQQQQKQQGILSSSALQHSKSAEKLRKYARKLEAEKKHGLPASPLFAIGPNRHTGDATTGGGDVRPSKPFYEGQINYYLETKDDDDTTALALEDNLPHKSVGMGQHALNMERVIAADSNNWYRRVSPVLRNGIKATPGNNNEAKQATTAESEHKHSHHHQHQHQHNHQQHRQQESSATPHRQQQHSDHHHSQHHHRSNHHKHHQHGKHYQSNAQQQQHTNPYQRKLTPYNRQSASSPYTSAHAASFAAYSAASATESASATETQTPIPPPAYRSHTGAMQELGHQITEMEEFERYYAKWPHLARVQFQVYDEHYRETHPEFCPEYDEDYESAAELEEAQSGKDEDANLPPYIKKYNRRNKQLLNLLEGTLPPATRPPLTARTWSGSMLQPGPHETRSGGALSVRVDDDYLKEKRRRYHRDRKSYENKNYQYWHDLFAPQRSTEHPATSGSISKSINNNTMQSATPTATATATAEPTLAYNNHLPDENISAPEDEPDSTDNDDDSYSDAIWPKEIENKSNANELAGSAQMTWQMEKLTTPMPTTTTTLKAAIFRLPSYPAIAGSFIGKPRSRSAQFAPSTSRGSSFIHASSSGFDLGRGGSGRSLSNSYNNHNANNYYKPLSRIGAYQESKSAYESAPIDSSTATPEEQQQHSSTTASTLGASEGKARTISSFVYHRVVDASPRLVGTGAMTGRKQRLPFVAITDRRLDTTSKKSLSKDFEQNHYPMP